MKVSTENSSERTTSEVAKWSVAPTKPRTPYTSGNFAVGIATATSMLNTPTGRHKGTLTYYK